MALKFWDNFGWYVQGQSSRRYSTVTTESSIEEADPGPTKGPDGGPGVTFTGTDTASVAINNLYPSDQTGTAILQFKFRYTDNNSGSIAAAIFGFRNGSTATFSVLQDAAGSATPGKLYLNGNPTIHADSGSETIPIDTPVTLGLKLTGLDTASGTVTLRMWEDEDDPDTYTDLLSATGLDFTSKAWTGFFLQHLEGTTKYGHLLVMDGTGSDFNDFVHPGYSVNHLMPTGNGATSGWTPSAGSNYQNVDESPADDDTTYNSTNTTDVIDLYQFESVDTGLGDVMAVAYLNVARLEATPGDVATMRAVVREDGANTEGLTDGTANPDLSYTLGTEWWPVDHPAGGAWTAERVNTSQFGTKFIGSLDTVRMTQNVLLVVQVPDDFVVPTPGEYTETDDVSDPCCGSGSSTPTQGQTGDIPQVNPYQPHNPGASTTTCVGGGDVPTAADLTDPEDWRTLLGVAPNVIGELIATKHPSTLGSTTYRWADQWLDVPLSSAHAEGRVRKGGWSEIRRAMAMPDQYPEVSRAGVTIDEQDALVRTLLDSEQTAYLKGREWIEWLVSETRRKASGTMTAIFRGIVAAFNPGPGRTYTIEADDHLTSPFGVFDLDKPIPQALIDHEFFGPGGDDGTDIHPVRYGGEQAGQLTRGAHKDLIGTPIPIIGGICSDRGATSIDGQDAEKGAVPLIWVRDVYLPGHLDQIFGELLVCLGEVAGIEDVYGSDLGYDGLVPADPVRPPKRVHYSTATYGVDVFVPGHSSWPFETNYRERTVNGKTLRYTAIYMRGPRMTHVREGLITATVNVCGPMGENGQVITQVGPFLQWFYNEHVCLNEGTGYRSGDYHTLETYPSDATVPYLQPTTFAEFQTYSEDRIAGGYIVSNFQLRERITLRELERRFMQDYEVSFPINRQGQKMLRWPNWSTDPTSGTLYKERIDMDEPLPPFEDAHDEIENVVTYICDRDHDLQTWRREAETLRDEDSILAHRGEYQSGRRLTDGQAVSPLEVYSTGDIATVRDVFARRLARKGRAARYQVVPTDLRGLYDELGDQIRITHSRGVGASGYDERPFQVLEHRLDPNTKHLALRAFDLTRLQAGSWVWAPDDAPEFSSATAEDLSAYLYWADADGTTGDDPGKRWQ